MELNDRTLKVWDKSENCKCNVLDCSSNHKLCGICDGTIIFGAHVSNQPTSQFSWDIDHIVPSSRSNDNSLENLQVSHISCNRNKANR